MLFGSLNADIFTLFSGPNRRLYEEVLVKVYEECFRADLLFPTQSDVVGLIYDGLAANIELWREDEAPIVLDQVSGRRRLRRRGRIEADAAATTEAIARARHVYARLLQTGWLEESRYGLKVTVDMPSGAMRLAEFLCALREGLSEQLGGLVIEVKNALEAVRTSARDNALGLNKAARDAAAFGRYMRSVLSSLRDVDRQVLDSKSVEERLRHYFEDFVERVLLRDYAAINTTAHPYRFRHRIFQMLQALDDSVVDIDILAGAYREARLAADGEAARRMVYDDLLKISRVFDRIDDAFQRIQQHRGRIEARLRNTVRYAGRRGGAFIQHSEHVLLRLDRLLARSTDPWSTGQWSAGLSGALETRPALLSPLLLAQPRGARPPIVGSALVLPGRDPLWELRKTLERDYLDRLAVRPAQVARFLERRVPPFGEAAASHLWIGDLDDFLAFEALRLAVASAGGGGDDRITRQLRRDFEFRIVGDDPVQNDWLRCGGFLVRRKTDTVTLEDDLAA